MDPNDILINIRKIVRAINLENKRIQKEFGISIPQLLCLEYLNNQPQQAASHKSIKEFLQLNASTVTGIIARLQSKGLIRKLPKKGDKRVQLVALSKTAQQLFASDTKLMHSHLSEKLENLNKAELLEIQGSLEKLVQFMQIPDLDASPVITSSDPLSE